jgi:hypothetical protein
MSEETAPSTVEPELEGRNPPEEEIPLPPLAAGQKESDRLYQVLANRAHVLGMDVWRLHKYQESFELSKKAALHEIDKLVQKHDSKLKKEAKEEKEKSNDKK